MRTKLVSGTAGATIVAGLSGAPWFVYLIVVVAALVVYGIDQYVRLRLGEKAIAKANGTGLPLVMRALFPAPPDDRAG